MITFDWYFISIVLYIIWFQRRHDKRGREIAVLKHQYGKLSSQFDEYKQTTLKRYKEVQEDIEDLENTKSNKRLKRNDKEINIT